MSLPPSDAEVAAAVAQLPPVSAVLQRILQVLQDPRASIDDIARLVRAETALAAQVLRSANSAYFGMPTPATSVDEAIQRLGIAEISRLVNVLASRQLFLQPLRAYGIAADALWQHTLAVAVSAETLATYAEVDRNLAHLAGVLHPVGMVALEQVAIRRKTPPRETKQNIRIWEQANFARDNAAMAGHVLRHWQFPEPLVRTVAGRFEPAADDAAAHRLYLASLLAEKIGAALPGESGEFRLTTGRLEAAAVPWDAWSEAEVEAGQNLERTRALLQLTG